MDFEQLKTFLEVWHQKSFSRAARKLRITQPAVSAQILSLEREVGERLFDRKGGKITFTAAGRVFEPFAEHALDCQRHLLLMISEQRRSPRGEISISAQESTSLYVLPDVFAEFKKHFPKVALKIARAERSRTIEALLAREVDFGVVSLPVTDKRFMVETIHVDELVLATPKGHPLCSVTSPGPKDIAQHSFLLPKQGRQRDLLLNLFRMHDVYPKTVMEVESSELMKRFVRAGLGIGFLPSVNIEAEIKAGDIAVVKMDELRMSRDLGLIYLKEKSLTHAAKAFLQIAIGGVRLDPVEPPARKRPAPQDTARQ
ncbi:LysR family transcriptional regulator [Edaphobacter sp.]|uniref:LysR family transcriptional regulator n=1 Tax=Edaphobacter sp. TaxID=1934404 RepID=UPI002DB58BC3|nr:LysR family transcriptional regulator [Edaphobacter sp.]HEU5340688.1 LysR family transcriptional regulator [Edaphobacter sp.]